MKHLKAFESKLAELEVLAYLRKCLKDDKNDYRYNWNDDDWIVNELINFIGRSHSTSYIFKHFFSKYTYYDLEKILIDNYPKQFDYVLSEWYDTTLEEYLLKKDMEKYNL
jgi:hypothetical protein